MGMLHLNLAVEVPVYKRGLGAKIATHFEVLGGRRDVHVCAYQPIFSITSRSKIGLKVGELMHPHLSKVQL